MTTFYFFSRANFKIIVCKSSIGGKFWPESLAIMWQNWSLINTVTWLLDSLFCIQDNSICQRNPFLHTSVLKYLAACILLYRKSFLDIHTPRRHHFLRFNNPIQTHTHTPDDSKCKLADHSWINVEINFNRHRSNMGYWDTWKKQSCNTYKQILWHLKQNVSQITLYEGMQTISMQKHQKQKEDMHRLLVQCTTQQKYQFAANIHQSYWQSINPIVKTNVKMPYKWTIQHYRIL